MSNEVQSVFLQSLEMYLVNHCDEKLNEINSLFASFGFNQSFNENDLKDRNLFAHKVKILCSEDEYNISPDEIIDKMTMLSLLNIWFIRVLKRTIFLILIKLKILSWKIKFKIRSLSIRQVIKDDFSHGYGVIKWKITLRKIFLTYHWIIRLNLLTM